MKFFNIYRCRFVVLQAVLVAGLFALYLQGYLQMPFVGEQKWFSIVVCSIGMVGVYYVFRKQFSDASWIAAILVRIAVVCMLVALIGALTAVSTAVLGGADTMKVMAAFLGAIGIAFYGSLCAIASNLWLELLLWRLGGSDETAD